MTNFLLKTPEDIRKQSEKARGEKGAIRQPARHVFGSGSTVHDVQE